MSTHLQRLLEIMALLRDPERGCPWDVEQTFATIAPHTIEEAYEVAEAIDLGDMAALREELGDLLLQVVFHAQMAGEAGDFGFEDVAEAICDKLIRRHPHVFGSDIVDGVEAQNRAWEAHKEGERRARSSPADGDPSALEGVPVALPAVSRALKLQKRAARVGFDWRGAADVLDKFTEEIGELTEAIAAGADAGRLEDELGDLLFTCVNAARKLGIDPEQALRHGNAKFETRFRRMEALLSQEGRTMGELPFAAKEEAWQRAKREAEP